MPLTVFHVMIVLQKMSPDIMEYDSVMQTHHFSLHEKSKKADKSELLIYGKMPRDPQACRGKSDLTTHEILALESLLGTMLDQGKISETCKMAAEFSHYSQDLAIILVCPPQIYNFQELIVSVALSLQ
jgi:hypothetical protein